MKRMSDSIFVASRAGMEFCWIYAWVVFVMHPILKRPFPLPEGLAIFALAGILTAACRGRGWRVIYLLLLHVACLAFFALRSVHLLWYGSDAFLSRSWAADFFGRSLGFVEWLILAVFLGCVLAFWAGGVRLVLRRVSYLAVCNRFDLGFAMFFGLLIVRLVMRVQHGIQPAENLSEFMIYPFFVFALLAIALARNQSGGRKDFLAGYRGIGLLMSFSAAVLFLGTGLVLLFLPYLQLASAAGYEALKFAGRPLVPIIIAVLRFLLMRGQSRPGGSGDPSAEGGFAGATIGESGEGMAFFLKICLWGLWGVLILAMVLFLCFGARILLRWLFSRTAATRERSDRNHLTRWIRRWIGFLVGLYGRLFKPGSPPGSIQLYSALLRWGCHSGVAADPSETPLEYGWRLKRQFRPLAEEIDTIVAVFNRQVYGQRFPDRPQLNDARLGLRRMQRPALWLSRLKRRMMP
jgi:hypothetical protein